MRSKFQAFSLKTLAIQKRLVQAGLVVIVAGVVSPVQSQIFLPNLLQTPKLLNQGSDQATVSGWIHLDGRRLIQIVDQKSDLPGRIEQIEQRLDAISNAYFKNGAQLKVYKQAEGNLQVVIASVGNQEFPLLTVTNLDAEAEGVSIDTRADQVVQEVKQGLIRAKQERQPQFLYRQGIIAGYVGVSVIFTSLAISRYGRRSKRKKKELASSVSEHQPISTQLEQEKQWNMKEVQHRGFQLIQAVAWGGGTLIILGLFPYTRPLQILMITIVRIPVRIGLVSILTYFLIRLSYALIDRSTSTLGSNYLLGQDANQRVQLRVSTISGVAKSIVTICLSGVGFLIALSVVGVDIGPLLAGAGILGVAVSLASQNLIKDAINGFFIILEDQYAIGDVINVGDVGGLVEDINLRITRLRDAEGRLITIPNSEIKIVANLSSNWSRADLNIPVAYQVDVDKALKVINEVAQEMDQDSLWQKQIIEPPAVLGVENFADRGIIIRVWIKTLPLKQWDVAREFRRRIKNAFEQTEIPIPLPQQQLWFGESASPQLFISRNNDHS